MIKKILLLSLVVSQLTISCSSEDSPENQPEKPTAEQTLAEQIANIVKQPYSKLTPADQKIKVEVEANEMLVQLDKSKSSGAIEAIQNLGRLFSLKHIDLFDGKSDNGVEEVLNISGVYGIYTWDNTNKTWIKTASTTELKFVFPAKASQTANNAILTSKSTSSDIKFSNTDTYGEWNYNNETQQWENTPSVVDWFYLPTSVDAVLTIDGTQSATLASTAKYSSKNKSPEEYTYKVTLNDGYTWEMNGKKAAESTSKASFTYNGKNLIEFNVGSTADIDNLINTPELNQYKGKANGLVKIMDNFVIVSEADLVNLGIDSENLEKSLVDVDFDNKDYYTNENSNNLKYSQGTAASLNKNIKAILASKKDGTKIADVVVHSEADGSYNPPQKWVVDATDSNGGYWTYDENSTIEVKYYTEVYYLKFNDNTEVAMSVYFSKGFENLNTKFKDFYTSFKK
ncbi:hypothetical protein CLU81_3410 [Flavobacterium sp. 9]|uniref:hypothetical protein n=1 Tax=Flavobacterium sp. 9 TaxID=2035198 RepID=UPI000C18CC45|nr:hypothetical protein [Flavobacterium sp. 9]PIF32851.1 hypothetical protein CLU81_3410 [Flavobacterium sp. 9]